MAKFDIQGKIDDTESFVDILENFNRDAQHVEDRIKKLVEMGFEMKFKVDDKAIENDDDDVLTISIKPPK